MVALGYQFVALTMLLITSDVATVQGDLEAEMWESACKLDANSTLKYEYYSKVRSFYGDSGYPQREDRYIQMNAGATQMAQCYSSCKNAAASNVTWCIYIYHPEKSIEICLNKGGVVMETPSAALLGLREKLSIQSCPGCNNGLSVVNTPYYFNNAYFVCTSRNASCTRHTFAEISIEGKSNEIKITEFPEETVRVAEGKTRVLKCSSSGTSALNYLQWSYNNRVNYTAIYEDPFCNRATGGNCDQYNTSVSQHLDRVRMYVVVTNTEGCIPVTNIISYLIIDNATTEDEGLYTCTAFSNPLLSSPMHQSKSLGLNLQVVAEETITITASTAGNTVQTFPVNNFSEVLNYTGAFVEIYGSNFYIYALIFCLLLITSTLLFCTALLIGKWKHKPLKPIMNPENAYTEADHDNKTVAVYTSPDPWRYPEYKLALFYNRVLGRGAFGKVLLARAVGIIPQTPANDIVAVKIPRDGAHYDLFDELELMKRLKPHENIINFLGYSILNGGPLCLIVEYAMHGNLRNFLKSCKDAALSLNHHPIIVRNRTHSESYSTIPSSQDIPNLSMTSGSSHFSCSMSCSKKHYPGHHTPECAFQDSGYEGSVDFCPEKRVAHHNGTATPVAHTLAPIMHDYINCKGLVYMEDVENFALQIASGLKHLSEMEIIHCDLATRNILIGDGFVLKISDFGMARDISGKEYLRKSQKDHIPVKWTSPEALKENLYTVKNDIWSFGVVLWEIFTYGQTPYPDFEINSVEPFIQFLKDGNRLCRPDGCPESMYNLMQLCWDWDHNNRPSAQQLMGAIINGHSNPMCSS